MRPDIRPGGVFPDYSLPDHTGTVRTLSELQGRDPLVLTLARGNYCPKEHQQHLELAANYPKLGVASRHQLRDVIARAGTPATAHESTAGETRV
jgi:peroxiredoxin